MRDAEKLETNHISLEKSLGILIKLDRIITRRKERWGEGNRSLLGFICLVTTTSV